MSRRRGRLDPWATVCSLLALAVLLGLGTWQLERGAWKQALNAERAAAMAAAPLAIVSLAEMPPVFALRRARLNGRFLHEHEVHLVGKAWRNRPGVHVLTPLMLTGGGVVLVNRGFVPNELRDPARRAEGQPAGEVVVEGLLRPEPETGYFTPGNQPEKAEWYWIEIAALARTMALDLAPLYLEVGATTSRAGWPVGLERSLILPDNHLGYALTWYGLAGALVAVYLAFHWRRRAAD